MPNNPTGDALIRAFLIPGVFGDEPALVEFRRRLRSHVQFDLVILPEAGASGALLTSMAATAAVIAEQIVERQPAGDIRLIGFSFGASAALETAVHLTRAGRTVSFLGILDGPFDDDTDVYEMLLRPTTPKELARVLVGVAGQTDVVRRFALSAASPLSVASSPADMVRKAFLKHLRNKALKAWRPDGCQSAGVYVSTGHYGIVNRERWLKLCPNLTPVEIVASHEQLLSDDALDAVVSALIDGIGARGAQVSLA